MMLSLRPVTLIIRMHRLPMAALLLAVGLLGSHAAGAADRAPAVDAARVERGRYLVRAGDCAACHTKNDTRPFAGGLGVTTPFGTIYSSNLTPDAETGLGKWSADDFYRAMHTGKNRAGKHLYPAFPYVWFTKLTRADTDAIKAWLDTLTPIRYKVAEPDLPWPLSWRFMVTGWNLLFFDEGEYRPDTTKSAEWNRGAYLVEGAGHCGACHTPMNFLGGSKRAEAFSGNATPDHWYAANLTADTRHGLGDWSQQEIVELLRSGSTHKTAVTGSMAEVISKSTQYLSDADLNAIALYLKSLPARAPAAEPITPPLSEAALKRGEALYFDNCMGCHMVDGGGIDHVFPPLKLSAVLQGFKPDTVVQLVLQGHKIPATEAKPTGIAMPGFAGKLDDQEVVDVVNYVRNAWGNRAPPVQAELVATIRAKAKPTGLDGAKVLARPQAVAADRLQQP